MICVDATFRIDRLIFNLIMVGTCLAPVVAFGQVSESDKIDFTKQIAPIFEARCISCHGPMMANGGLRLDRKKDVQAGGYSQMPVLGGTLKTNEIYLRVASKDRAFRMPKGADPLTAEEISLVKRWVEQGTPWIDLKPVAKEDEIDWFDYELWMNFLERWLHEVPGFIPWLLSNLGIMIFLWFVERYKQAAKKGSAWTVRPWTHWLRPLQGFHLTHFLLIAVTMGWILTLLVYYGQSIKLKDLSHSSSASRLSNQSGPPMINSVYGNPPIPHHPGHPARLRGEYYRGNCERNEKLFNGGNYRTGTLRVSLVDSQGHDVNYGDLVDPTNLAIRFELDRPQGTTPALYGDSVVKSVFLTTQLIPEVLVKLDQPVIRLTETKPGWKWEATVPLNIPKGPTTTTHSGLIYVYHGAIEKNKGRGTLHYGIKFDLKLKESVLQPDSQVWMGSLFWTPAIEHPNQGKVPLKEWFDDEPIPEVTGENTKDPVLLGIPEHEEKLKVNK